ncbi:NAD(P)-dependent oxidoreductase [Acidiphilium multivorum]|uniref:precorrin-2 dehydrogenase n=1 Tax=Acidiphilium multivorum (strain DSM 11245 / JCM 8867 / NBRC 100883 / AIU 301) TaxID=926570 RepID=F0J7B8_ACIMA|nr:NAD(P)-dependent oxidoreductase [Acidiphilium multivorum]MBS3024978.1 siroheme synthase [Acidiphilium multivorum]BAJ82985.1 hypothetical protein ACMV_P1_01890 [Acidiphilium multivorum AIU301]GAN74954.1 hypothetical protein Apmu_0246_08 [Acidiphilium multivorum AIU301]
MIPIVLDPSYCRLSVCGNGPMSLRRLRALREGGADAALLFSDDPDAATIAEAGAALCRRMPTGDDLARLHALWIVDVPDVVRAGLVAAARAARVLVNVEDRLPDCDFHSVAQVRRGDLLLTVSTGGQAAGLSSVLRRHLEVEFGADWAARLSEIAVLRERWRAEGMSMPETARRIADHVEARGWLTTARGRPPE